MKGFLAYWLRKGAKDALKAYCERKLEELKKKLNGRVDKLTGEEKGEARTKEQSPEEKKGLDDQDNFGDNFD